MANKDDYLTEYRQFFEEFANTVEPNDQLPVKLGSYKFLNSEVVGGIIDWCLQYLNRKSCPSTLVGPLIRITIDEIRKSCRNNPIACGFNPIENVYEPLKLMQTVMSKINEICLQYLDNSRLDTLPTPPSISPSKVSMCATRNTRRRMEDRHVVIHDMHSMFNIPDTSLASYYAIFDGHAGSDAAAYSAAHLHQFLAESEFYPTDPERALKEAFSKTDEFFLEKSKVESFRSGTTAVCALLRPKEEMLYVAWVGDSQALLVNNGKVLQIVKPHKPSREDEKDRIEANGGCVMFWGMWRVNGQLAVSRAIGDFKMKPYVTAEPDVVIVPLDGNEEFLIMACDGLWDFVSEDDAAICVYNCIKKNPENVENIAESLADLAKQEGSRDNISVIVIFLKDPSKIAKKLNTNWGWTSPGTTDAAMETGVDNQINNASNNFDLFDVFQKRGTIDHFNDESDFKSNGTDAKKSDLYLFDRHANGKRPASDFEDDLGPETNIDSLDDISPTVDKMTNKIDDKLSDLTQRMADIVDEVVEKSLDNLPGNNNFEKMEEDVDLETQGQNYCGIEPVRDTREETATPPADSVLDSSGLADNVAESEDSEDEWNYYRVDPEQKEATTLGESDNKIADSTDEMSQLNPDAKEFVPVSPTRATGSPAPFSRDLVDDTLLAQSPRRAIPMDINVPSPGEFQFEVKQRPSELFDEFEDKNPEEQNGHQLSSQEIMQNLLNGKNVNEIEFRPQKLTPDNIFGNNVDSDNQNVLETDKDKENASVSEEKTESSLSPIKDEQDFSNFVHKAQDPMNMSFYQDKDEETAFSSNPFDLNKVQLLPANVDEFIQQPESPLGVPLAKSPLLGPNRESPVPISNKLEVSKSPESKSLVEIANSPVRDVPKSDSPICSGAKTPEIPTSTNTGKSSILDSVCNITKSAENLVCDINKPITPEIARSPNLVNFTSFETNPASGIFESPIQEISRSPETTKPLELQSPEHSPMGPLSPKSPIPELTGLVSPDITASIKDDIISGEISDTKSPFLEDLDIKTPDNIIRQEKPDEIAQNLEQNMQQSKQTADSFNQVSDDLQVKIKVGQDSKVEELISDAIQDTGEITKSEDHFENQKTGQISTEMSSQISDFGAQMSDVSSHISDVSSKIFASNSELISGTDSGAFLFDSNSIPAQYSDQFRDENLSKITEVTETSFASAVSSEIVNSFLERSALPEVTSPLSPSEEIEKFQTEPPENFKLELKCEIIKPEFPVHTITSPSEESKGTDTPPSTPAIITTEPELKTSPEPQKIVEAVGKLTDKKPSKTTTKPLSAKKTSLRPSSTTSTTLNKSLTPSASTAKKTPIKTTSTTNTTNTLKPRPNTTSSASPRITGAKTTPTAPKMASSVQAKEPIKKLTNGDIKPKNTLARRPAPSVAKTAAEKKSTVKSVGSTSTTTSRAGGVPASKLAANKTSTSRPPTTITAPKLRPTNPATKSTSASATTKIAPSRPTTTLGARSASATGKPKQLTSTADPKPHTGTTVPKPRLPSTLTAKATSKASDAEKQQKDTVNKQLSASKITARPTTTKPSTLAARKPDLKTSSTRNTTRTITATTKPISKKPEVTKTAVTKTKTTKAITEQNGVNIVQEITTTIEEPQLIKDNSPVEIDNTKIEENIILDW